MSKWIVCPISPRKFYENAKYVTIIITKIRGSLFRQFADVIEKRALAKNRYWQKDRLFGFKEYWQNSAKFTQPLDLGTLHGEQTEIFSILVLTKPDLFQETVVCENDENFHKRNRQMFDTPKIFSLETPFSFFKT